jgi:hypothetical protein
VATIDEFRIYNGALSDEKIVADYAAGPSTIPSVETAPKLYITKSGAKVILSWPSTSTGYSVQTTSALGSSVSWGAVTENSAIIENNGVYQITLTIGAQPAFYRLKK